MAASGGDAKLFARVRTFLFFTKSSEFCFSVCKMPLKKEVALLSLSLFISISVLRLVNYDDPPSWKLLQR